MIKFHLLTKALPTPSRQLSKAAVHIVSESILDKDKIFNIDLALSEACANVVRHAYKDREPGDLEILVTLHYKDCIEIEVADWGSGFDSWPVNVQNAAPHAEGGRGLFIMSELADIFDIRKECEKNIIYMKIKVEERLWTPSE